MSDAPIENEAIRSRGFIRGAETQLGKVIDQAQRDEARRWFERSRYGLMMHFSSPRHTTDSAWNSLVNAFDVDAVVKQIADAGASYLLLTVGQNTGWYCSPNAAFNEPTGYEPGAKLSTRDLPADLIAAGVKLMLYVTASPAGDDPHAQESFGFATDAGNDPAVTTDNATRWAAVLREWSERYGDGVAGWWVDGSYDRRIADVETRERVLGIYADAMRAGNPGSLVAFNGGRAQFSKHYSDHDDYTAGELDDFGPLPPNDWTGETWHALTPLGVDYGNNQAVRDPQAIARWITNVNARSGIVTLDVGTNRDADVGPVGSISEKQMGQLLEIKKRWAA